MAEIASAFVSIIPSLKGAKGTLSRELDGVAGPAGKSSGRKMGSGMAAGIGGMATKVFAPLAAAAATVSVGGFLKDAVNQASDLNESSTKLNAIFGKAAGEVQKFAAGGAKALGQTKLAVLDASATFGTFGKAAGLSGKDLAGFSTQFASLSTDLASFYNTSPEQAVEAIGAALRGEAEPMRQYGVLLDDATMRQQALKMGLIKTTKQALTPQQKVLAAQAVIMKQTKDAQGDFARTSGGLANQQRILSAQWSDMKTNLGAKLLPVVTKFVTFLNNGLGPAISKVGQFLKHAIDTVKLFIGAFTGQGANVEVPWMNTVINLGAQARNIFDAILPVIRNVFASFQSGGASANTLRTVLATVATFVRGQVVPALMGIITAVRGYLTVVIPIVQAFVAGMMARIRPMMPQIKAIFATIGAVIVGVMGLIRAVIQRVTAIIGGIWSRWGSNIMNFAATTFHSILAIISGVLKVIQGVIRTATAIFKGDWSGAWAGIKQIVSGAWDTIKAVVSGALKALGGIIRGAGALLKAAMSSVGDKINGALDGLADKLRAKGSELIQRLIDGILGKIEDVKRAAGKVAQAVKDFFPGSPVKEGPLTSWNNGGAGKRLGGMLADGLTSSRARVQAASRGLASSVASPVASPFAAGGAGSGAAGASVVINGNVGWQPDEVARKIASRQRDAAALYNLQGVTA